MCGSAVDWEFPQLSSFKTISLLVQYNVKANVPWIAGGGNTDLCNYGGNIHVYWTDIIDRRLNNCRVADSIRFDLCPTHAVLISLLTRCQSYLLFPYLSLSPYTTHWWSAPDFGFCFCFWHWYRNEKEKTRAIAYHSNTDYIHTVSKSPSVYLLQIV